MFDDSEVMFDDKEAMCVPMHFMWVGEWVGGGWFKELL